MSRHQKADAVGDQGELLPAMLLSRVALVNPFHKDKGLDFFCELRDSPGIAFLVQAKGSEAPTYTSEAISALPVSRDLIESYWFVQSQPVFITMSDTRRKKTYYYQVTPQSYKALPRRGKTCTFRIPLRNELKEETLGEFVARVVSLQPQFTSDQATAWIRKHREGNPRLYQNAERITFFLEVMRGSDQSAQVKVKNIVKSLSESRELDSETFRVELLSILKNCKDRITQHHVVDTLVSIKCRRAASELIRQIIRNMNLPEYQNAHPEHRHVYTSFLFDALVKLEASEVSRDVILFLQSPEMHIVQSAVRTLGCLKPRGGSKVILSMLDHPDDLVRYFAAEALSNYGHKSTIRECGRVLSKSSNPRALAGAIQTLAKHNHVGYRSKIVELANHEAPEVRLSVVQFLNTVGTADFIATVLQGLTDKDFEVQSTAARAIVGLELPEAIKEEYLVKELITAFDEGNEPGVETLLGLAYRLSGESSIPVLLRIFKEDDGLLADYRSRNSSGGISIRSIDLKTSALRVLTRLNVRDIWRDITCGMAEASLDLSVRYIIAAKEMKIKQAFGTMTSLCDARILQWRGFISESLVEIDRERAKSWAVATIRGSPSLVRFFLACDLTKRLELTEEVEALIGDQITLQVSDPFARLEPQLYNYIREYMPQNASALILEDLETARYTEVGEEKGRALMYRMLDTLLAIKADKASVNLVPLFLNARPELQEAILGRLRRAGDDVALHALSEALSSRGSD